ncbi:LacI family DNA-binding transcriptional regulator [Pelagicoccus sp. SDUM812005]|uniref:LacI family DNA-binding transcriptional regulator n=1 Tax=Pelagicoccus sp. SDUM812005 TaxID=3041257 RepID=UPI00280DFDB2|nr:LacI family DNA-binding transcriptional regulator [Pelagicoccus sp. SDUM812005]MDQ8179638.1 LacI family DNA-binding transcriptional regulator [Pelagicoccus sp. SDUM812005]
MPQPARKKGKRPPTLADVGREAGVSAMAVSAVLNGSNSSVRISEETQRRIRKAAADLRYRPNIAARALVNRRMNTIGTFIVVEGLELNHYFLEVFNGIIAGASKHKQNVTVFTLDTWSDAKEQLERAFDGRIDGMILIAPIVGEEFAKGMNADMPCVSLHSNVDIQGIVNLESDEEKGAYEMVRFLIEKGHRRILHLAGPRGLVGAERRIAGYKQALSEAGIAFEESLLKSMAYSDVEARAVMTEWLQDNPREALPDAIFCANDQMALGCVEALSAAGLRVPEDVSVSGFDDTLIARVSMPPLTTVRQPLREMGMEAVSMLLKRIDGEDVEGEGTQQSVVFPTELVVRKSVEER